MLKIMLAAATLASSPATVEMPEFPEQMHVPTARPMPAEKAAPIPEAKPAPIPAAKNIVKPLVDTACHGRLTTLGVTFKPLPPFETEEGCGIADPVEISALGGDIRVSRPGTVDCETAEVFAEFSRDTIAPVMKSVMDKTLSGIRQSSLYVCRVRNGTTKKSEHAYGRAVDIGAFLFADGSNLPVEAYDDESPGKAALDAVREAACGPFKTVLGPGSNADHATHFHFDLARRRNGSTWCK